MKQKLTEQNTQPDIILKGSTFSETVDGIKYWEIRSVSSNLNKEKGSAHLESINGIFFNNDKPVLGVAAPSADWDLNKKEILINSPVGKSVLKLDKNKIIYKELNNGGFVFVAQKMKWGLSDKKLVCSGGVILKKEKSVAKGDLFESDVLLGQSVLSGNPEALVNDNIKIVSDKFILKSADNSINVSNGVKLTSGNLIIYADNGKYIEKQKQANLWGNVSSVYQDITAAGKQIIYKPDEQSVSLSGEAKVIKSGVVLKGDIFEFSLKSKNVSGHGSISAVYKDIYATGGALFYSEKDKTILVSKNVKSEKDGNVLTGENVIIDLNTGRVNLKGKSRAVITENQLATIEVK